MKLPSAGGIGLMVDKRIGPERIRVPRPLRKETSLEMSLPEIFASGVHGLLPPLTKHLSA